MTSNPDQFFAGSIPQIYQTHLVPLIFEPYALDMATRVALRQPAAVLELAAGTGVVTRRLAASLAPEAEIIATDLNQAMLDQAVSVGISRPVEWRQADALNLPFPDESFDAVVCQFGAMFFSDKARAFHEARRVLRPGGALLFSVWDRIEQNEFAQIVIAALAAVFPEDPPRFLPRTPHGYADTAVIRQDLANAGFAHPPVIITLAARSRAASPEVPALAYCQGTPIRNEIEARDPARLSEATNAVAEAIGRRFGPAAIDGKIQAHIITVER
jgi:ubiquinone/menaquinone biosynthesis C-methylase UbiE